MTFPITRDKKIDKISKVLLSYAESKNLEFCLGSRELKGEYAFSYFGILPMFLLDAKESYEKIMNNHYSVEELLNVISPQKEGARDVPFELKKRDVQYMSDKELTKKFPLQFFETKPDETLFDFEPRIEHLMDEDKSISFSVIIHFVLHSFEEYFKIYEAKPALLIDGRIPLDPLCDKWFNKLKENPDSIKMYPLEVIEAIDAKKNRN